MIGLKILELQITHLNEDFKTLMTNTDEEYFLKFDVQYLEKLHDLHDDLPFLPEIIKLSKVEKLLVNIHGKTEYVMYIRKYFHWVNQDESSILSLIKMLDENQILI